MHNILIGNIKEVDTYGKYRYKSKYIISESYLYILIRYIENNPIEANITNRVGEYPFTLGADILQSKNIYPCCENSILLKEFTIKNLIEFLAVQLTNEDLKTLQEKEKVVKIKEGYIQRKPQELKEYFILIDSKEQRNEKIVKAYLDGYTQVEIGNYLNLSKSMISKVVKSGDSTSGV